MTYTRRQARPLLTDDEYELFGRSLSDRIAALDEAELRDAVKRTRRARDKARDLHRRQAAAVAKTSRSRGAARTANERTERKAIALEEALGRFEKQLDKLTAATQRARRDEVLDRARSTSKRSVPAGPNRAARRAAKRTGSEGQFISRSAQTKATSKLRAPQTRITASRGAAGRRTQARRDNR